MLMIDITCLNCVLCCFFSKLVAYKIILKLHNKTTFHLLTKRIMIWIMVFNATFRNITVIPDLPLCLSTGPRGPIFLPTKFCYNGFLLMWCNFKFEGVLFRSDSRDNDRVDCLCRPTRSTSFRA
jgi:hypothetical protein